MSKFSMEAGCRVRLKGGYEVVYPKALAGLEGWVRQVRTDPDGYERVYIEWDKEHWRYKESAEGDLWTFASHFEVIEPAPATTVAETAADAFARAAADAQAAADAERENELGPCPHCGEIHESLSEGEIYLRTLNDAVEKTLEGSAYIIFTMAALDSNPDIIAPHVYAQSLDRESHLHLMRSVGELVAEMYSQLVSKEIFKDAKEKENGRKAPDIRSNDQEQQADPE